MVKVLFRIFDRGKVKNNGEVLVSAKRFGEELALSMGQCIGLQQNFYTILSHSF